jgi:hypothetical protein
MSVLNRNVLAFTALLTLLGGPQTGTSRAPAISLFPEPSVLGSGWVRPWEVPAEIPWLSVQADRVSSEKAYWAAVEKRIAEAVDASVPASGRLLRLRALARPSVVTLIESLRGLASRLRSTTEALRRAPGENPREKALAVMGTAVPSDAGPGGASETEAALEARNLAASVNGSRFLTYLYSADWNAAARAKTPLELAAVLDQLTVRIRLDNPGSSNPATGSDPADMRNLRDKLQNLLDEVVAAAQGQRIVLGDSSAMPRLEASAGLLSLGKNSALIQCGVAESSRGVPIPNHTSAWMRRGNMIAEVDLDGSMSRAAGESLVRAVLGAVDEAMLRSGAGSTNKTKKTGTEARTDTVRALGLEVGFRGDSLVVVAVEPGSPAEKTSIRPGWALSRINETPIAGLTLDRIRDLLLQSGRPFAVVDFILPTGEAQRMLLPLRQ